MLTLIVDAGRALIAKGGVAMQKIGIALLIVGIAIFFIVGGTGFLEFILSPEVPVFLKVAVFSIVAGALLIILSSLGKKDKYEEVKK